MEAFGPIKRNIYRTIFHFFGGLFIMLASIPVMFRIEKWSEFEFDHPNFMPGCWMTGGLISALCQAHILYCYRSSGCLTMSTFLLAINGSTLFMIFGILRIYEVAVELIGYYFDDDVYKDYWNMSGGVLLSACVLYILHSLMYPFACYKMIIETVQDQNDSGVTYSNPNAYQKFPMQPLNDNPDEDNDISAV